MIAIAHGLCLQIGRIGTGTRLRQAIAGDLFHCRQVRQQPFALLVIAETVDHPRRHIVDGNVRRCRSAARRQFLENDRRIQTGHLRPADIAFHIDARKTQGCRFAQCLDRKYLLLVPLRRMRRELLASETAGRVFNGALIFGQFEIHRRFTRCFAKFLKAATPMQSGYPGPCIDKKAAPFQGTIMDPKAAFPAIRMRRLRQHDWSRRLVAEHTLSPSDFIWPIFVIDGENRREPVPSMPGVERLSADLAAGAADEAVKLGKTDLAIFPATDPSLQPVDGREALNANNIVCRAVRAIKKAAPQIGVLCDVALDPYTDHGHDGVMDGNNENVANDATLEILVKQALVQAEAGCDIIAPSDMMDGRIGAIRIALEKGGYT